MIKVTMGRTIESEIGHSIGSSSMLLYVHGDHKDY